MKPKYSNTEVTISCHFAPRQRLQHFTNVCKRFKSMLCHPLFMPQALSCSVFDHTCICKLHARICSVRLTLCMHSSKLLKSPPPSVEKRCYTTLTPHSNPRSISLLTWHHDSICLAYLLNQTPPFVVKCSCLHCRWKVMK